MLTISIVLQYNIHIVILFSSSDNPEDQMVKGVQSIAIKQLEKHHFEKKKIYNNYICHFNLVALMKKISLN